MAFGFKSRGVGPENGVSSDRLLRRLVLALSLSVILHIALAIFMRPDYKKVADRAVDFTVTRVTPGPPAKKPEEKLETEAEPKAEPKEEPKPKTEAKEKPATKKTGSGDGSKKVVETEIAKGGKDGGAQDAGPEDEGDVAIASSGGTGTGICMPNLFPFFRVSPSWLLWVSLSSFRETALENAVASTLARYAMGKDVVTATGLNPEREVEGVLVGARDIFAPATYQIVVGYDSSEGKIKNALSEVYSDEQSINWTETEDGWVGDAGASAWNLVGSGRVLVASPKAMSEEGLPGSEPKWPKQVECVSQKTVGTVAVEEMSNAVKNRQRLMNVAKSFISPDPTGRWPVAMLATNDPRTLGLGSGRGKTPKFEHARIRAFFSEPILIEGEVKFEGTKEQVEAVAALWRRIATSVSKDPFFAIAGLSSLFDKLTLGTEDNKIVFSLILTEGQARAGLMFLQLQGEALERHLKEN